MRIVHFSDWHWHFQALPKADLYICTGDMMPNFAWPIRPEQEEVKQTTYAKRLWNKGGFQQYLGAPDAPLLCVRGNHDFINLGTLFQGCKLIHEFKENEIVEFGGIRITGHRGIPYMMGTWSDEMGRPDLYSRWSGMTPMADLYLTHYPPEGILDSAFSSHLGLEGVQNWFYDKCESRNPLHCFGHIHEEGGRVKEHGGVTFSNAATAFNVIEGDPDNGWRQVSP